MEREAFQYTVLRFVPSVEREEFLNVGVVLFCRRLGFLGARVELDTERAAPLAPDRRLDEVAEHLDALATVAAGDSAAGALGEMPPSERFGWLAAPSSTVVQSSPVHTGLCTDPAATLERLFARLVTAPAGAQGRGHAD